MFQPKALSAAMVGLRAETVSLLDQLSDDDLEVIALPDWSVADVLRHLADSDRGSVLGKHLLEFLPGKDLFVDFQAKNDRNLERLRTRGRNELRAELVTWGRRMAAIVRVVPSRVGAVTIPTAFGKVPVAWMAGLRLYDEWVHQWDVAQALARPVPTMPAELAEQLGHWQLLALEADALAKAQGSGIVEVAFSDSTATASYDLAGTGEPGAGFRRTTDRPTSHVTTDVATFCLLAAERVPLDQLLGDGSIKVDGDEVAARALCAIVRVV